MVVLRIDQLQKIRLPHLMLYVKQLSKDARENYPDIVGNMTEERLQLKVIKTIKKAEKYGVVSQLDIAKFLNIAIEYGWDFDEDPEYVWMRKILINQDISCPSDRIDLLMEECDDRKEMMELNRM
jgi:hypothetical protein